MAGYGVNHYLEGVRVGGEHGEVILLKENKVEVRKRLKDGRIDYLDLTSWSFQDWLFGFLIEERFFEWCGSSYPTPRERENISVWFLVACALQMKLHRSAAFHRLEYILRSGSILTRVRFNVGLRGGGFNGKNRKERKSPIDQETARKFFTDTKASEVEDWYNTDGQKWLRRHRGYSDREGIFILDPTLICLPDNPNLKATHHEELATQTIETLKQEERLGKDAVIVYAEKYFAVFDLDEYTDIILHLKPKAHQRMCGWIKKFRREKIRAP